nr:MAG TPA: Interferon regulatory factor 3 [Caudoviricetes sp.]DAP82898.1 MAG TPA: Interferon regulatory factor [Caudoviricetes sp.]
MNSFPQLFHAFIRQSFDLVFQFITETRVGMKVRSC